VGQRYGPGIGRYVVPVLVVAGLAVAARELVDGDVGPAAVLACWVGALGTAAHLLFARPSIRLDARGVTLRNPLRDVVVPWVALVDVQTRGALTLVTTDGSYVSWAAAAGGRPRGLRSFSRVLEGDDVDVVLPPGARRGGREAVPASRGLHGDAGAAAFVVESAWERWGQGCGERGARGDVARDLRQDGAQDDAADDAQDDAWAPGEERVVVTWRPLPAVGAAALALLAVVLGFG